MHLDPTLLVIPASIAGGTLGVLAFWNGRARRKEGNNLSQLVVLLAGSVAFVVSLLLFAETFGPGSVLFAVTVTVLVAAWAGMFHTVVPLRLPAPILKV